MKTKIYTGYKGDNYTYVSRNVDGPEILKWMREFAAIKAFGLKELPKWKGSMLGRFVELDSLKAGRYVITYVVMPDGLKRNFIPIDSETFSNDGTCSIMGALSKESLMKNILKYKDGKRVDFDGQEAIQDWISRWFKYKAQNGIKGNSIKLVLNNFSGIFPSEWLNEDLTNIENVKKICQAIVEHPDSELLENVDGYNIFQMRRDQRRKEKYRIIG